MNYQLKNIASISALRKEAGPAPVICGLWLRVGFIGASAVAVGLMQLFGSDVKALPALALAIVGGLLATYSWRRARTSLDDANDAASTAEPIVRSPANAVAG